MNKQDIQATAALARTGYNWQLLKILGQGGEGTAYLVVDCDTSRRHVVKILHSPRPRSWCKGLQAYANSVTGGFPGLPMIELLEDGDLILGVAYEHRPLYAIHYRLLRSWEHIAQALVGSYCRMQSYLISTCSVALMDTDTANFLLARDGRFHWIDYGYSVSRIDEPGTLDRWLFGYGFARLLMSLHYVDIQAEVKPSYDYSYTQPCRYCMDPRLDVLALKHGWLCEVLAQVRRQSAAAFLKSEFYERLGAHLPAKVAASGAVLFASNLLYAAGHPWGLLRRTARGERAVPAAERPQED